MSKFRQQYGEWALVTGGATGLGQAFANELASKGQHIVIADIRGEEANQTAKTIESKYKVQTKVIEVNLGSKDYIKKIEAACVELEIGTLVNNAGIAVYAPLVEADEERLDQIIDVNCKATVQLTKVFGAKMKARKKGAIVIVSSLSGTMGTKNLATYSASKAFGLNFGEAIWEELRQFNIDVKTLVLGAVNTPAFHWLNPDVDKLAIKMMEVDEVAKEGIAILHKNKPVHVVGSKNRWAYRFMKLFMSRKQVVQSTAKNLAKLYPNQVNEAKVDAFYNRLK